MKQDQDIRGLSRHELPTIVGTMLLVQQAMHGSDASIKQKILTAGDLHCADDIQKSLQPTSGAQQDHVLRTFHLTRHAILRLGT